LILVTGAAGFIGSNVVAALNERGRFDVVVCDRLGTDQRWQNLRKRMFRDFVFPEDLMAYLDARLDLDAMAPTRRPPPLTATR
jgi:ADP-L-glycero-D-manno-heptose 6-epimerase